MTDRPLSRLFLDKPTNELRQGDVCFEWLFPKWQLNSYQVISESGASRGTNAIVSVHSKGDKLPLVICSNDCDLENPRSRTGFIVAPLFKWPAPDMGSETSLDIISSYAPAADGSYKYINLYPIKIPSDPPGWRIADFSALTSISTPKNIIPTLRGTKRFEMTDEARENFGNKLAAFFIRQN